MKRVIVRNLAGVQTHGAEFVNPQPWIDDCVKNNLWGKPERWQPTSLAHDPADVIASELREVQPAMAAVIDANGNEVEPAKAAVFEQFVKLRAEYTVEIQDITAEVALAEVIRKRKADYPTAEDFMDAWFDGGQAGLNALRDKRNTIKAKYPKPAGA